MRLLHLLVVALLIAAAGYVYEIKFEATVQAERLARLRTDIRKERDDVARLRAEWARLDNPARIQGLAERHLKMRPVEAVQIGNLGNLPQRPPQAGEAEVEDPIGAIIERDSGIATGSVPPQEPR